MKAAFAFLHGGGQGGWVWEETLAALALQTGSQANSSLCLDIPGCGRKRGRETRNIEVPDIVAELIADIEAFAERDIILVGHSQAGTILPLLLAARPALFRRVIYVSCLAPTGNQTALNWREAMPEAGSALHHAAPQGSRERYRAMFCNDMRAEEADAFLDKLGHDRWPDASYRLSGWHYEHLAALPASYILCTRDAVLVPPWQQIFAERLQADITRIDAGHQVMNTRPQALAELLRIEAAK